MKDKLYIDTKTGESFGGDEFMYKGIELEYENEDFVSFVKVFQIQ